MNINELRFDRETRLREMMDADPQNMELKASWIMLQRALAWNDMQLGETARAGERLRRTFKALGEMMIFDADNRLWADQRERLDTDMLQFASTGGRE